MKILTLLNILFILFFSPNVEKYKSSKYLNSYNLLKSSPLLFTDTTRFATLYVYRRFERNTNLMAYNIHVADSVVCRTRVDSKYIIKLYKEGPIEIWAKTEKKSSTSINVEFGKEYYLKCEIKIGAFLARPDIRIVSNERGKREFDMTEGLNSEKLNDLFIKKQYQ